MVSVLVIVVAALGFQHGESARAFARGRAHRSSPLSAVWFTEPLLVEISGSGVAVDGHPIVALRDGRVDASSRLHDAMLQQRERLRVIERLDPARPFDGRVLLVVDPETRYETLQQVVYTLGQTDFRDVHYVVMRD